MKNNKSNLKIKLLVWSLVVLLLLCLFLIFHGQTVMRATHVDSASIQDNMGGYVSTLIGTVVGAVIGIFGALATQMFIDERHKEEEELHESDFSEKLLVNDFNNLISTEMLKRTINFAEDTNSSTALACIESQNFEQTNASLTPTDRLIYLSKIKNKDSIVEALCDYYSRSQMYIDNIASNIFWKNTVKIQKYVTALNTDWEYVTNLFADLDIIDSLSSKAFNQYQNRRESLATTFSFFLQHDNNVQNYLAVEHKGKHCGEEMDKNICFIFAYIFWYNCMEDRTASSMGLPVNGTRNYDIDLSYFKAVYSKDLLSTKTVTYHFADTLEDGYWYNKDNVINHKYFKQLLNFTYTYERYHSSNLDFTLLKYFSENRDALEDAINTTELKTHRQELVQTLCNKLTDSNTADNATFKTPEYAEFFRLYTGDTSAEKVCDFLKRVTFNLLKRDKDSFIVTFDDDIRCLITDMAASNMNSYNMNYVFQNMFDALKVKYSVVNLRNLLLGKDLQQANSLQDILETIQNYLEE